MPKRRNDDGRGLTKEEIEVERKKHEAALEKALVVGRPGKLTPELTLLIQKLIVNGVPKVRAATIAGISERAFYKWKALGTQSSSNPKPKRKYARFVKALEKAESICMQQVVDDVRRHLQDDGKLGLDFLTKRFPEEFGNARSRLELSGPDGGAIKVDGAVTLKELDALRAAAKANADDDGDSGPPSAA